MATDARVSQLLAEILRNTIPDVQVSQVVLEMLRANDTEGPLPVITSPQPVTCIIT